MCYIVFISHSWHWRYIKIALQEYVKIGVIDNQIIPLLLKRWPEYNFLSTVSNFLSGNSSFRGGSWSSSKSLGFDQITKYFSSEFGCCKMIAL